TTHFLKTGNAISSFRNGITPIFCDLPFIHLISRGIVIITADIDGYHLFSCVWRCPVSVRFQDVEVRHASSVGHPRLCGENPAQRTYDYYTMFVKKSQLKLWKYVIYRLFHTRDAGPRLVSCWGGGIFAIGIFLMVY
ncbi:MAG: hypothetical protein OXL96_11180, partial [Candidatus Poribacteria bacterium]|nr:hypothetical protein [Candidatus Poribacteria bacterium]